eukprot:gene5642-biopygen5028
MREERLRRRQIYEAIILRRGTAPEPRELREDEPHPVAGLPPAPELVEHPGINRRLRQDEMLELGHAVSSALTCLKTKPCAACSAWTTPRKPHPVTTAQILALIRTVHTAIYLVMVAAIVVLLYGGVTGQSGPWLWGALGLLAVESAVFAGFGFKCPLTALAVRYGARTGHVFDTFLPERA